jgi:4,5:9,10-diseco-3-hydroxy-5,9,17-trioxoandrosta-1(10),2-diene-4-oate hydrolase
MSMPVSDWEQIDWRTHQRWVTVRGRPMNVIDAGSGEPIVFVHGLGGCWHNWLEQLPRFARDHRVIAFDLPGFGDSPLPHAEISVPGYALIVRELLDLLEVERATVVGNSMGGLISVELTLAAPERVARLALVSPAGVPINYRPRQLPKILVFYPPVALAAAWVGDHADAAARRPRLRRLLLKTVADHPRDIPAPLAAEQFRGVGTPGFLLALEALVEYSITDRLEDVSCPTLIVWGEHDHVLPARHADVYATAITGSRKVVLPETGHVAMLERPQEFNELLAELLLLAPASRPLDPQQALSA